MAEDKKTNKKQQLKQVHLNQKIKVRDLALRNYFSKMFQLKYQIHQKYLLTERPHKFQSSLITRQNHFQMATMK